MESAVLRMSTMRLIDVKNQNLHHMQENNLSGNANVFPFCCDNIENPMALLEVNDTKGVLSLRRRKTHKDKRNHSLGKYRTVSDYIICLQRRL